MYSGITKIYYRKLLFYINLYIYIYILYTGRFIMYSGITKIYYRKLFTLY